MKKIVGCKTAIEHAFLTFLIILDYSWLLLYFWDYSRVGLFSSNQSASHSIGLLGRTSYISLRPFSRVGTTNCCKYALLSRDFDFMVRSSSLFTTKFWDLPPAKESPTSAKSGKPWKNRAISRNQVLKFPARRSENENIFSAKFRDLPLAKESPTSAKSGKP